MFTYFIMLFQQFKSKYRQNKLLNRTIYVYIVCFYLFSSNICVCFAAEDCIGIECIDKEILSESDGVGAHLSYSSGLNGQSLVAKQEESESHGAVVYTCKGGRTKLLSLQGYMTDGIGNYSLDVRCTWLIDSGQRGLPIKLSFEQLATECAWDHVHVYDGDSAFAPKVAAFSGLVMKTGYGRHRHEVITHSGSAFIYFYSDAAFTMSGFNVSYTVNSSCSPDCKNHGQCVNSVCRCQSGWAGPDCMTSVCPAQCNCDVKKRRCICPVDFHGADCSVRVSKSAWTRVYHPNDITGRSSHSGVAHKEYIYLFGGYSFTEEEPTLPVIRFNTDTGTFEQLRSMDPGPSNRYSHTTVLYKDHIYLYGGSTATLTAVDELWTYDLIGQRWNLTTNQGRRPIDVTGHTAHVIGRTMYVVFGYSPMYGYVSFVQKYDLENGTWSIARSKGAIVTGAYGAASAYDPRTRMIYVHAGYRLTISGGKNDDLFSFHVPSETWHVLRSTGQVRHLHSAVMIDGLLLIFGGNTDNDVNVSSGAKCYSNDFVAYDPWCDRWIMLEQPSGLGYTARYGHTAALHNGVMYVFGGFNGELLTDVLVYEPGRCYAHLAESECITANQGVLCAWTNGRCVPLSAGVASNGSDVTFPDCPSRGGGKMFGDLSIECARQKTCASCLASSATCNWCDVGCIHKTCPPNSQTLNNGVCSHTQKDQCDLQIKCSSCHTLTFCLWNQEKSSCQYTGGDREAFTKSHNLTVHCPAACSAYTNCVDCTTRDCMWCASQGICTDSDAYLATFPYGQCLDWSTRSFKCPATECSFMKDCYDCLSHPQCGWCDDGNGTGAGVCISGGNSAPVDPVNGTLVPDKCPAEQWFFTECPRCQCNGHSRCHENTATCVHCKGNTIGPHCENCGRGYWGTALNGGKCDACDCNEHAVTCDKLTGKCQCQTKGIVGKKCDRCDASRNYHGNPNGGTCYYNLATDFEIRFNLSSPDEKYVTKANFMNIPPSHDRDLDFYINCSKPTALLNVTVKTNDDDDEFVLISNQNCYDFNEKFSHSRFSFGTKKNTTIYVYLFNFTTPIQVTVTFTQFLKINLFNFFITFFGCFLSLLLVAALFWKVKQRYDLYTRRQRALIEMEKMMKRPFATILVKIGDNVNPLMPRNGHSSQKTPIQVLSSSPASVIGLEPIRESRLAVVSVLLEMPLGGGQYPPPNQSGLAIASTLACTGHIKPTQDKPDLHKRKHAQSPAMDTCI